MLTESRCARATGDEILALASLGALASGNLLALDDQELEEVRQAIRDRAERNKNPFWPPIFDAGKSDCFFSTGARYLWRGTTGVHCIFLYAQEHLTWSTRVRGVSQMTPRTWHIE